MKVQLANLLACWLACLLTYLRACLLFGLLCLLVLICFAWLTCEARAVEHQKLNQTTPYGVVWLSFWCSTYLPWFALSSLSLCFSLVCLLVLLWFGCLLCFYLLCCTLLAYFAYLCLLGLLSLLCLLCDAWLSRFHLTRLGLCALGLIWLGRLASWHALDLEYIYRYIFI